MKPFNARLAVYVATWIVALLSITQAPKAIVLVPLFPAGLGAAMKAGGSLMGAFVIVGWIIYGVHGWITLTSQTRLRFWLLWIVLAVLLMFNVAGCKRIIGEMSNIH